ncbi:MAG: hypothetical protein WCW66_01915 [Patescibacteria group bacterium]
MNLGLRDLMINPFQSAIKNGLPTAEDKSSATRIGLKYDKSSATRGQSSKDESSSTRKGIMYNKSSSSCYKNITRLIDKFVPSRVGENSFSPL